MTTIAINGRFMTRPPSAVDRFATQLLRAWLSRCDPSRRVRVLVPSRGQVRTRHSLGVRVEPVGMLRGHAWEQTELASHAGDDVLLGLANTGPMTLRKQLVLLHDAGVFVSPSMYSFAVRNWYRPLLGRLLSRAGMVATVSASAASDLMKHAGVRAAGIEVIYGAGEHVLRVAPDARVLERLQLTRRRYVLALGTQAPSRNFNVIVKASALLRDPDISIVAIGGSRNRVIRGQHPQASNLILTDYVPDSELRALYENAQCFVMPSLNEGFPLAALEAMQCGCPVIASRSSSLPEVLGDAVIYCDPFDPADVADQISRLLESPDLQEELCEAGRGRARAFSWARSAEQLERLLTVENWKVRVHRRSSASATARAAGEPRRDSWKPSAVQAAEEAQRGVRMYLRALLRP